MILAKKVDEYFTSKLVFLDGKLLIEGVDYTWKNDDLELLTFYGHQTVHVLNVPENIKCDVFSSVISNVQSSKSDIQLDRNIVFSDWNALLNSLGECPYEIVVDDRPKQLLLGFRCPTNGDTWHIGMRAAASSKDSMIANRIQIANQHNKKVMAK